MKSLITDGVLVYEMGLSREMNKRGITMGAFIEIDHMMAKYGRKRYEQTIYSLSLQQFPSIDGELNATFIYPREYIVEGLPFVKNSMFQYHFRPLDLLFELTKKAYEADKDLTINILRSIFESLELQKKTRGFIIAMSDIIYSKK